MRDFRAYSPSSHGNSGSLQSLHSLPQLVPSNSYASRELVHFKPKHKGTAVQPAFMKLWNNPDLYVTEEEVPV